RVGLLYGHRVAQDVARASWPAAPLPYRRRTLARGESGYVGQLLHALPARLRRPPRRDRDPSRRARKSADSWLSFCRRWMRAYAIAAASWRCRTIMGP